MMLDNIMDCSLFSWSFYWSQLSRKCFMDPGDGIVKDLLYEEQKSPTYIRISRVREWLHFILLTFWLKNTNPSNGSKRHQNHQREKVCTVFYPCFSLQCYDKTASCHLTTTIQWICFPMSWPNEAISRFHTKQLISRADFWMCTAYYNISADICFDFILPHAW